MSVPQEILDRVAKLRALSNGTSNINESTAAATAAAKIVEKYRISEEELDMHETVSSDPIELVHDPLFDGVRLSTWKERLGSVLGRHYGCACWIDNGFNSKRFRLVGRKSDVELVRYMFAWLALEIDNKALSVCAGKGKTFSNSWRLGAVAGVSSQFNAMRAELKKEATASASCALVKLENRANESDVFMRAKMKLRKQAQGNTGFDYDGYFKGKQHGESIHLGKAMGENSTANKLLK
jgi:hypothetical protein